MHLRVSGKSLAQCLAPGQQPLDHECRFEEGRVPVRGAAFQSCGLPGLRDVKELAGLRRGLPKQPRQRFPLPDARNVKDVAHDHEARRYQDDSGHNPIFNTFWP
jgi:hypothetical protein